MVLPAGLQSAAQSISRKPQALPPHPQKRHLPEHPPAALYCKKGRVVADIIHPALDTILADPAKVG
jgi:hypothetical protein